MVKRSHADRVILPRLTIRKKLRAIEAKLQQDDVPDDKRAFLQTTFGELQDLLMTVDDKNWSQVDLLMRQIPRKLAEWQESKKPT